MTLYDAIVIGAGPAGGECVRSLSAAGKRVLVLEKARDFAVNDFSSGGAPIEVMEQFDLPDSVVAKQWRRFFLSSSQVEHCWDSSNPQGVVFDFCALRRYLASHAEACLMGAPYQSHEVYRDEIVVHYKGGESRARCLVDASGTDRKVFGYTKSKHLLASGLEHLIEVDEATYQRYGEQLSFYLGQAWMPQGYAWIFPMSRNKLKVGVARYFVGEHIVPYESSFLVYMDRLMARCLGRTDHPVLDKHGKTLRYTYGRQDTHVDGRLIAIGDAVSSINPMGGEGVRHGMYSGRLAAEHIVRFLNGETDALHGYSKQLKQYTWGRWWISEKIMHQFYAQANDLKVDAWVRSLSSLEYRQLLNLVFHYKISTAAHLGLRQLLTRLRALFGLS